jgi:hypothetical protein
MWTRPCPGGSGWSPTRRWYLSAVPWPPEPPSAWLGCRTDPTSRRPTEGRAGVAAARRLSGDGIDDDPAGRGGWVPLVGELGTLDLERDPDDLAITVDAIRVFAGYAGWGPGQLESEIEAGGWFVVPAESGDALSGDPDQLWKRVLRRQGGRLALVAAYPNEPSSN